METRNGERERERERGWKKEQMRQKAITRLEIEKRNQIKWRKVKFKDCADFRSKDEWTVAFRAPHLL